MEAPRIESFEQRPVRLRSGQPLRRRKVADVGKAVVRFLEADAGRFHLPLQPVMAVATKLQPERRPRRDAQMAEAKLRIDKIDIEMLALARRPLELEKARLLALTHLEASAPLDGSENADHPLAPSAGGEDLPDDCFLALAGIDLPQLDPFRACPFGRLMAFGRARMWSATSRRSALA